MGEGASDTSKAEVRWRDATEGVLDLFDTAGNPISETTIELMTDATSWLRDFYDGWRENVRKRLRELERATSRDAQGNWCGRFQVGDKHEFRELTEAEVKLLEGELEVLEGEHEHLGEKPWTFEYQTPLEVVREYLREVSFKQHSGSTVVFNESKELRESIGNLLEKFTSGTLSEQDLGEFVLLGGVLEESASSGIGLSLSHEYEHVFD